MAIKCHHCDEPMPNGRCWWCGGLNKYESKQMTDPVKIIGRVIKVSKQGWGFISSKEIEFTRIFFHWTALRQDTVTFTELKAGMQVEFTPIQIPGKGWRAVHVRVVERERTNDATDMSALQE